eukprot:TRINITY_DN3268_c0_g2_i4.p1 TRINITY_DN3268_c0_g2~~TRINITY_DN3268_c0_g2_i4.p1  ORF type:complete len:266 (+),score=28.90 TRINITY_DN3268_c0_g2_i4:1144-1941(+)
MYTAALEERLLIASLVEQANLEIKKAQEISDKRIEAFRIIQQSYNDLLAKVDGLESKFLLGSSGDQDAFRNEISLFRNSLRDGLTIASTIEPIRGLENIGSEIIFEHHTGDLKNFAMIDSRGHRIQYGSTDRNSVGSSILSSIYGGFDNDVFVRLESAFRAIEKENQLLRDKYIRWQVDRPNVHGVEDRERIIDNLEKRILELNSELNQYKSQSSVSVNVSGNIQDYENKIRTLTGRITDLESQLRNSRQPQNITQSVSSDGNVK